MRNPPTFAAFQKNLVKFLHTIDKLDESNIEKSKQLDKFDGMMSLFIEMKEKEIFQQKIEQLEKERRLKKERQQNQLMADQMKKAEKIRHSMIKIPVLSSKAEKKGEIPK